MRMISNSKKIITFIVTLFPVLASYAASLQVYPVNINFSAGENVKAVYVKNTGTEPISAQIRVYGWTQKNQTDVYAETHNLVVSPPITAIPGGQQQLIRLIMPVPPSDQTEQAYKLVVDELPGAEQSTSRAVRFLLRYNLPVFINTPKNPVDFSEIIFHLDKTSVPARLWIENKSNKHLKLSNVVLSSGTHKSTLFNGLLGYVLANSSNSWPLPKGHYSGTTLTFNANDNTETQTVPIISN